MNKINLINIKNIDLIIYDFDGVLTDNKVLVFQDGGEAVFCNRSDGLSISKIKQTGIPQIIISTEKNEVVKERAKKLGIPAFCGVSNKRKATEKYCREKDIDLARVIYIGNDINDLDAMRFVGYPMAPLDASDEVKNIAKIILKVKGGDGVVRELLNNFKNNA